LSNRLIDAQKGFKAVYAVFRHQYLGCLMSSHVVQELPNGRLSLQHQGLNPKNMDQFASQLDEVDRKLVRLLFQLNDLELMRRYAPRAKSPHEFFQRYFSGELQKMVVNQVSKVLEEVIQLLPGKPFFIMAKDGYPAYRELHLLQEKAHLKFHFDRRDQGTLYYPKISLEGKELRFDRPNADIICEHPAWVLVEDKVFTFEQPVEGKKLTPFLNKGSIVITPQMESSYFQKFVPQLMEHYEVVAKGLDIVEVKEKPECVLRVLSLDDHSLEMLPEVVYGDQILPLAPQAKVKVSMEQSGAHYRFVKVHRDPQTEADFQALMDELLPATLLGAHYFDRQQGLGWLSQHVGRLQENGIRIVQEGATKGVVFDRPEIVMEAVDAGDWFDIKAIVDIGGLRIPFIKFRSNIIRGQREFKLPDGRIIILPESWFSDFRHLLEIAEERPDNTLSIRRYQAVVLDMATQDQGLRQAIQRLSSHSSQQPAPLPLGLKAELRTYQKAGYEWLAFLREVGMGGILADDMGLGKTLQTLALLLAEKERGAEGLNLVVMPTSLVYNWLSEARKFCPDIRVLVHTGQHRAKDFAAFFGYQVVLTTYGILRSDLELFQTLNINYLILDESQMIKNASSKTAQSVRQIPSKHRLSLTGTPLENTLMDLWSQLDFLNPGLLGSESFFREYYALPIEKSQDKERGEQLRKALNPFILRRTKEQVASELPPKVEQLHYCEMAEDQREYYEKTKNAYRNYLLGMDVADFSKSKLHILAGLQKLRQIAIHPALVEDENGIDLSQFGSGKYEEFQRLFSEVVEKGAKVLVFSQFVRLLHLLRKDLESKGVPYCYLDGATKDRRSEVERFQNNPEIPAFLISLKAGGVGLNLTAAEYVFILDPWWNPAVEAQAIDRSHRIGQTKTVFSYKFITRDSIEEKIVRLQDRKKNLSNEMVGVEENIFKSLDLEDLKDLLA
jgi:hypothetical protein